MKTLSFFISVIVALFLQIIFVHKTKLKFPMANLMYMIIRTRRFIVKL